MFGPDVATASRADLGGMIGNNSAGARSIVYGKTVDHVRSLTAVLSDGTRPTFGPLTRDRVRAQAGAARRCEGDAYRAADAAVRENARRDRPAVPEDPAAGQRVQPRRALASGRRQPWRSADRSLTLRARPIAASRSLVGSEGTLAVVAEAELALVPRPKHRGLLVPQFASLAAALDALAACLELGPSAVELMDQMLHRPGPRQQRPLKDTMAAVRGRPAGAAHGRVQRRRRGRGVVPRRRTRRAGCRASPG